MTEPIALPESVCVEHWPDPLVEEHGYPMGSEYCETFWLPTLGPTPLWLARRLVTMADDGVAWPLGPLAQALGLSPSLARNGALCKAVDRLARFDVIRLGSSIEARSHLAPLAGWQVARLPEYLQRALNTYEPAASRS